MILDSDETKEPPFRLIRSAASKESGIRVSVKTPDSKPVANIDVVLRTAKGELTGRTSDEGIAKFDDTEQPRDVSFEVRVYDLRTEPIALNQAHNDFFFEINGEVITQFPFKNERLKIDGKALLLRRGDDPAMRYERQ